MLSGGVEVCRRSSVPYLTKLRVLERSGRGGANGKEAGATSVMVGESSGGLLSSIRMFCTRHGPATIGWNCNFDHGPLQSMVWLQAGDGFEMVAANRSMRAYRSARGLSHQGVVFCTVTVRERSTGQI
jgi:hypothetical protein